MRTYLAILTSFFILLLHISCNKIVDVPNPEDRIAAAEVFKDDATALSAISGLYVRMQSANIFSNSGMTLYPGLSADELLSSSPGSVNEEFATNSISTGNTSLRTNVWASGYNLIFQANSILEGLEKSERVSAAVKNQLTGEAKFIRAYCHFYLVNLFGAIPLITTTDYQRNAKLPRASVNEVYVQIIEDLQEAKLLIPANYVSSGKVRPNKWAVTALLARVYLYRGEWQKAETESSAVINSGAYSIISNLNNVFLANSAEAIWQLIPSSTSFNTTEGNVLIPGTNAVPTYPINNSLLNSFATGDARKTNWIKSIVAGGGIYYYPFKYKVKTSTTITEYHMVLRYAEQLLIRAEARAHLNDLAGAVADVNLIRSRAGLSNFSSTNQAIILTAIEKERQEELFCEWGHRWFDLKRTNKADAVLSIVKGSNWQATDSLYPIPFSEILRNPALVQNPGY
jgi:hypothetical protein